LRLHFPANLREWERQPFFLTLIAKKMAAATAVYGRQRLFWSRWLGFLAISVKKIQVNLLFAEISGKF
jgi:hypothetical protein